MPLVEQRLLNRGTLCGLLAGALALLAELLTAAAAGVPLALPVRMMASVLLGQAALTTLAGGVAGVLGLCVHFFLSALFGWGYGALLGLLGAETRASVAREAALGLLYGLLVYLVDFQLLARGLFPWLLGPPQQVQLVLHAATFGLPLALLFTLPEHRHLRVPGRVTRPPPIRRTV